MEESIDFAYWLNTQRMCETRYMDREELKEMYEHYLKEKEDKEYEIQNKRS